MYIGLIVGFSVLVLSVLGTMLLTPALAAAVVLRRPRIAAGLVLPWLASLPCTFLVVAFARVYGDPEWRTPPALESNYVGETASLQLDADGRFQGELAGDLVQGTWTQTGPSPTFSTVAGQVHLDAGDQELVAVLRWDGKLGFGGQLLAPD